MITYVAGRLLAMGYTMLIILSIGFVVVRLMPGGLFDEHAYADATAEQRAALESKYNLDKPLIVQLALFLRGLVSRGDWGTSLKLYPGVPVWDVIKDKVPVSLSVNILSLLVSLPVGIFTGILAAAQNKAPSDHAISALSIIGISIPSFTVASLLQYFLAFKTGMFPLIFDPLAKGLDAVHSMALPVLALSLGPIARVSRYLRAELIETLEAEFITMAKIKGLTSMQAIIRHGIRNSIIPLVNIIAPLLTGVLGGSMVVENIFAIPGMGGLLVKSINASDYTVTLAVLVFYSFISLTTAFSADICYGLIDPRIKIGGRKP